MRSHLVLGGGRVLFVGQLHELPKHRFAANAVLVGLDDRFDLVCDGHVERHDASFVRGWKWHALDFHGGRAAVLFLEPGARLGRSVDARTLRQAVGEAIAAREPEPWAELFQNALNLDATALKVDSRVASVARFLRASEEPKPNATVIAERLGVSTSHIEHRFRDQLGVPMGAFHAWHRMQAATVLALTGRSLTEAAHATGFYDSAHFSRLFHRMFGLPPSKVFTPGLTGAVVEAPWSRSR